MDWGSSNKKEGEYVHRSLKVRRKEGHKDAKKVGPSPHSGSNKKQGGTERGRKVDACTHRRREKAKTRRAWTDGGYLQERNTRGQE